MGMLLFFSWMGAILGLFLLTVALNRFQDGLSLVNILVGTPSLLLGCILLYIAINFTLQIFNPTLHTKLQTLFDSQSSAITIDDPNLAFEFALANPQCKKIRKKIVKNGVSTINENEEQKHDDEIEYEHLKQIKCQGNTIFSLVTSYTDESRYWFGEPDEQTNTLQALNIFTPNENKTIKTNIYPVNAQYILISQGEIYEDKLFIVNDQEFSQLDLNSRQQNFQTTALDKNGKTHKILPLGITAENFLIMHNLGHISLNNSPRYSVLSIISKQYPTGRELLTISIKEGVVIGYKRQQNKLYLKLKAPLNDNKIIYKQLDLSPYI